MATSNDNDCIQIIRENGLQWIWDRKAPNRGKKILQDALGVRDTDLQTTYCYKTAIGGNCGAVVTFIDFGNINLLNPNDGLISIGIYVNLPIGSNNGSFHPLVSKGDASSAAFSIYELEGDIYFKTVTGVTERFVKTSGYDFCDGKTHLVIAQRDTRTGEAIYSLDILDEQEVNEVFPVDNLSNSSRLLIGAYEPALVNGDKAYLGTQFFGLFCLRGRVLDRDEKFNYAKDGILPANDIVFAQMDEGAGNVIFDSSGYNNHGIISSFTSNSRGNILNGFSWENRYGYSTGAYVIELGTEVVSVLGAPVSIDPTAMVPFLNFNQKKDVFGYPLEFKGRVRNNVLIKDILCYKANGQTFGTYINATKTHYNLNSEAFSIYWIAEQKTSDGGVIIASGDSPNYRYKFGYKVGEDKIFWNVGGSSGEIAVPIGMLKVVATYSGSQSLNFIVNGVDLGNVSTGLLVTPGSDSLLGLPGLSGGVDILSGGNVVMIGSIKGGMSEEQIISFMEEDSIPPINSDSLWIFATKGQKVFDVSMNNYHLTLIGYNANVWTGKQNESLYLKNGYTKIYQSIDQQQNNIIVPYDLQGRKINHNEFGSYQVESENVSENGHNLYDCFIDMNPEIEVNGFISVFWDKTNLNIWHDLDPQYSTPNKFLWNIKELEQSYLINALNPDFYNYVFVGRKYDDNGLQIEANDLVLINLGTAITPRSIPINLNQ